jgi:hypothetical protein
LDMGFTGKTNTLPTGVKTTTTGFSGAGSESTSRLGFRGTEDLGGGMSAFFTAEFQLYPTNESLSGDKVNGLNNRQTFVGLKKNGIGQAAIGTQYTPIHLAISRTTAAQQNNVVGDVIYAGGWGGGGEYAGGFGSPPTPEALGGSGGGAAGSLGSEQFQAFGGSGRFGVLEFGGEGGAIVGTTAGTVTGNTGSLYGGGGGGGARLTSGANVAGGAGAQGLIRIIYR